MRRRRETIEEEYLYKALQFRELMQVRHEKKSGQIEKIIDNLMVYREEESPDRFYRISDSSDSVHRMEDVEHTGAGNDNCAHILLWNRPGGSGYDMAAHGKAACVLGWSTGNCYGDDRDPLCDAVFPVSDV